MVKAPPPDPLEPDRAFGASARTAQRHDPHSPGLLGRGDKWYRPSACHRPDGYGSAQPGAKVAIARTQVAFATRAEG